MKDRVNDKNPQHKIHITVVEICNHNNLQFITLVFIQFSTLNITCKPLN